MHLLQRNSVEVVPPLASAPSRHHQARPNENLEMLHDGEARAREFLRQLPRRARPLPQKVENAPSRGVGERSPNE